MNFMALMSRWGILRFAVTGRSRQGLDMATATEESSLTGWGTDLEALIMLCERQRLVFIFALIASACGRSEDNPLESATGGTGGAGPGAGGHASGGTPAAGRGNALGGSISSGGRPASGGNGGAMLISGGAFNAGGLPSLFGGGGHGAHAAASGSHTPGGIGGTGEQSGAGGRAEWAGAGGRTEWAGGSGGQAVVGWTEQWNAARSPYLERVEQGSNTAISNQADAAASDGRALQLTLAAGAEPTPGGGVEAESVERLQYGMFSSRLRTADCSSQPNAGVVTGLFTYFNDGNDYNGDGLADNSEIDFEWLCAAPEIVYLTLWTDYRASDAVHKRLSRVINLRTGEILRTCYFEDFETCEPLTGSSAEPTTLAPITGYDSSAQYYEYGIAWRVNRVVWWIRPDGSETPRMLWDFRGSAARIPSLAASFMTNVWHTNNWPPAGKDDAVEAPAAPISAWVDWTSYSP